MVNTYRDDMLTSLNLIKTAEGVGREVLSAISAGDEGSKGGSKELEKAWEARFDWVTQQKDTGNE